MSECMLGCEVELFTYLSFALVAAGLFCWEGLGGPVMAPPAFNCWRLGGRKECVCGGEGREGREGRTINEFLLNTYCTHPIVHMSLPIGTDPLYSATLGTLVQY